MVVKLKCRIYENGYKLRNKFLLDFVSTMIKSAFDFQVVPLTSHVWQQSLSQENSRTQISDSNVASSEKTAQKGSGDDQVCLI